VLIYYFDFVSNSMHYRSYSWRYISVARRN